MCKSLMGLPESSGIDDRYLAKNLIGFISDSASVMMGKIKRVRSIIKSHYPQIVMWHCLNHRLELVVSDMITAVNGSQPIEDFFPHDFHDLINLKRQKLTSFFFYLYIQIH